MTEYSIRIFEDTRDAINADIKSFGDLIKVRARSEDRIVFDADEITASVLSLKTGVEVYKVSHATTDMGMQQSFLRSLQVRAANKKLAETAIRRAKADPVDRIDGQSAERYMAQADADNFGAAPAAEVTAKLEKAGLRLHTTEIPTLSVIFFDVADPKQLESLTLPKGWALEKLLSLPLNSGSQSLTSAARNRARPGAWCGGS
jgi:hypothetical protein